MKLAVTGKGGVGKTTVSALLAVALRDRGERVVAIDADPDSNLLATMGYPNPESVLPLVQMKDLIEERTGVKPGTTGGMFQLNPFVEDIPESFAVDLDGVKVLVAGAVKKGGSGCYCPENSLLRALVSHLLADKDSALILDMEAGVEHLGRGTVGSVDCLAVVVNPGRRSVETALRVRDLAADIGLNRIVAIGNMLRCDDDEEALRDALPGIELAASVPYDDSIRLAEMAGKGIAAVSDDVRTAVEQAVSFFENGLAKGNRG